MSAFRSLYHMEREEKITAGGLDENRCSTAPPLPPPPPFDLTEIPIYLTPTQDEEHVVKNFLKQDCLFRQIPLPCKSDVVIDTETVEGISLLRSNNFRTAGSEVSAVLDLRHPNKSALKPTSSARVRANSYQDHHQRGGETDTKQAKATK